MHNTPFLGCFNVNKKPFLVDTGDSISIVSTQLLHALNPLLMYSVQTTDMNRAIMSDGQGLDIVGQIKLSFTLQDHPFVRKFYVLDDITFWTALGTDFFTLHQ